MIDLLLIFCSNLHEFIIFVFAILAVVLFLPLFACLFACNSKVLSRFSLGFLQWLYYGPGES